MILIKIGNHTVELRPIKVQGIQLDRTEDGKKEIYVNKIGQPLKKVQIQKSEYKWLNEETQTEEAGKSYKSFKGKPISPFTKTKEVSDFEVIDLAQAQYFIENELTYLVTGDSLKAELKERAGKAYSFKYVNSGFKVHRAVMYYDEALERVIMRCFRGDLRKIDLSETQSKADIKADEGVEKLDLDAIEV